MLKKTILITLVTGGWFALVAQFILLINAQTAPLSELVIKYFSYFTLLSNILVAVSSTAMLFFPDQNIGKWCSKPQVSTALAVYIIVVGLVYNIVLRSLWSPQGLQKTVDELLHTVLPVLFVLYWFYFISKSSLQYNQFWSMLLFPLAYTVYTMIRGAFTRFYPYPFLDVNAQGWPATLVSIFVLAAFFIGLSLLMILIGKKFNRL